MQKKMYNQALEEYNLAVRFGCHQDQSCRNYIFQNYNMRFLIFYAVFGVVTFFYKLSAPALSEKGLAPVPWSRFYKFILPAPALKGSWKPFIQDFYRLQLPMIFCKLWLRLPVKGLGSMLHGIRTPGYPATQHQFYVYIIQH